jgi:hypothetical protein
MATHSIPISDDLWAALQAKSEAEGRAVEELAEEALRKGLDDGAWQELLAYGEERGRAAGFREEQAGDVVHAWRDEHARPLIAVTLDTSFYVGALNSRGAGSRLLGAAKAGAIRVDISEPIMQETLRVLREGFGWDGYRINQIKQTLSRITNQVAPRQTPDVVTRFINTRTYF